MKTQIKTILFIVCCCFVLQPATSLVAQNDPNEPAVRDNRDFKSAVVKYSASKINAEVIFYAKDNRNFSFIIYISTEGNHLPEYMVSCTASSYSVREHNNGSPGPEVFRGTPTRNQNKYSLKIPIDVLELTAGHSKIIYWFSSAGGGGSGPDRMPDSGYFKLDIK